MHSHEAKLAGRTALITGASKGIGAGIARSFAGAGAGLVLVARSRDVLEAKAAALAEEFGVAVRFIAADLSQRADVDRVMEEAGEIDVLVNNAAIKQRYMRLSHFDEAYWREVYEVGFWTPCLFMRHFSKGMSDRRRGVIINISSTGGSRPLPFLGHYSSSKAALDTVTRSASVELGRFGVRVLAIAPGLVDTDHHGLKGNSSVTTPLGRIGTTEDIGKLALFLASDDAGYITGHVYTADGGTIAADFGRSDPPYMPMVE